MSNKNIALFDIDETLYKGPSLIHFAEYLQGTDNISNKHLQDIRIDIKNYKTGKQSPEKWQIVNTNGYNKNTKRQKYKEKFPENA